MSSIRMWLLGCSAARLLDCSTAWPQPGKVGHVDTVGFDRVRAPLEKLCCWGAAETGVLERRGPPV